MRDTPYYPTLELCRSEEVEKEGSGEADGKGQRGRGKTRALSAREAAKEALSRMEVKTVVFDDREFVNTPIVPKSALADKVNPLYPPVPFFMLALGRSGKGKTNVLMNLLRGPYLGKFRYIYLFNPNYYVDQTYRKAIKFSDKRVFTELDEDKMREIVERKKAEVTRMYEKDPELDPATIPQDLLIVDDAYGSVFGKSRNNGVLSEVINDNRKYGISVDYMAHGWSDQVPRHIRANATHVICFGLHNEKEYQLFKEEMQAPNMSSAAFDQIFRMATSKPHSFLLVDNIAPLSERYSEGFHRKFILPI